MGDPVRVSMIASAVLDSVVLPVFIPRMWIRIRMQRVGCEDVWAIVAFVFGIINVVSNWTSIIRSGAGQSSVVPTWIYILSFTCFLWTVRISIILSIIRIIPPTERLYTWGLVIIAIFCLAWAALIVQHAIGCAYAYRESPSSLHLRCSRLPSLKIAEMTVGSVGDILIVIFPLCVLRRISLSRGRLWLLRLLFIANLVIQVICVVRMTCQISAPLAPWMPLVTNIQFAACVLACNLLVVVTYLCRVLGRHAHGSETTAAATTTTVSEKETPDGRVTSGSGSSQAMTLTTVELLFSTNGSDNDGSVANEADSGRVSRTGLA